jgi:hypothetical protein
MIVEWNKARDGFQLCWLWQFGKGPFIVEKVYSVPTTSRFLGSPLSPEAVEIMFEPGRWFVIAIPDAAYQYRVEYEVKTTMFHEKWFTVIEQ